MATVGDVLSHPIDSPTSSSSLLFYLTLLLGAAAIAVVFRIELRGGFRVGGPWRRRPADWLGDVWRRRNSG